MAEIKSSLELAMERTKKIGISEKEREEIKQKEILRKVEALFYRYREGHLPLSELLRELDRMDEKTRSLTQEGLLSRWIDALSLNDEDERLIKGVESLKNREAGEVRKAFHDLVSRYRREKERVKEQVKAESLEALRREGVYGSAVDPNIEGGEIWKRESEKLDHSFGMKLEEIKDRLRSL
ncbi:MAG: hypothetical protein HXY46_02920 [Syntrophaceae bacterium]|nr:hypothetical protein [Syntrophaceae bacterium]